mgnify:CR=1 FL=1
MTLYETCSNITTMNKTYQTIKIWKSTLEKLRLIYAMTGEQQVKILDRVISKELIEVSNEQRKQSQTVID